MPARAPAPNCVSCVKASPLASRAAGESGRGAEGDLLLLFDGRDEDLFAEVGFEEMLMARIVDGFGRSGISALCLEHENDITGQKTGVGRMRGMVRRDGWPDASRRRWRRDAQTMLSAVD